MLYYLVTRPFLKHTPERAFALRRSWLKNVAFRVLNFKVTVEGRPFDKSALYVSNHRSFSDPLILCRYLDAFIVAKAEVMKYPIINLGAELTGVLYVKREDKISRSDVRDNMTKVMRQGYNILIYPEGTIGRYSYTLPFKEGAFKETVTQGFSVFPVAIEYKDQRDIWIYANFLTQYLHQFSKWKTEVKLSFGSEIIENDGAKAKEKARDWINKELVTMQKDWTEIEFQTEQV
jgi:1-acyl-sn-glycerol-3-phosphate acyltransferase